ncbi:MAG: polyhydroxyalkanoic acid synthase [Chlorobi bacterium]|nr:polyhydroxyalkanoic acid synthase [Chlorobiota bacterium]
MGSIHIRRNHTLGKAEARKAVEDIGRQLKQRLQVDYHWNGDRLQFSRPGAEGTIDVEDTLVAIDIELGLVLSAFKGPVESQIHAYLDQSLGKG